MVKQFPDAQVFIVKDGQEADAGDVLEVLSLFTQKGEKVTVRVTGRDAAIAGRQIVSFINELEFFDGDQDLAFTLAMAPEDPVVVGTKALNLIKMRKEGIPVPPGFVVIADRDFSYQVLRAYLKRKISELTKSFPKDRKMIVSVRSSPMKSAPGLLETILNVGIDTEFVEELEAKGINGWKFYHEYLREFGILAFNIDKKVFDKVTADTDRQLTVKFAQIIKDRMKTAGMEIADNGDIFPMDFIDQLTYSIMAIKNSRHRQEVKMMLKAQGGQEEDLPTAVIVQMMAFGNWDSDSGSFTLSTIDDQNKGDGIRIEYGQGLQGKAIVDGRITAGPLEKSGLGTKQFEYIRHIVKKLQAMFGLYLQIEGAVESGHVYITQCRANSAAQQVIARKEIDLEPDMILAKTIYAKTPEKTVSGFALKARNIADLPSEGGSSYILVFEYGDAKSVRLLYEAVLNRNLNVRGVISGVGGSQSHFTRQIELLNDLGHDIPYMSDANYENITNGAYLSMSPDTYTIKIRQSPPVQMPLDFDFMRDGTTLVGQSI